MKLDQHFCGVSCMFFRISRQAVQSLEGTIHCRSEVIERRTMSRDHATNSQVRKHLERAPHLGEPRLTDELRKDDPESVCPQRVCRYQQLQIGLVKNDGLWI